MSETLEKDELQDLYRDLILDHARKPRNFRHLDSATHSAEGINPLCGDKLRLYLIVDATETIKDVAFEGSGCAISMSSASLLTETIADMSVNDADACFAAVTGRLSGSGEYPTSFDFSRLRALDGVREHPSRIKCATLAWHALHAALHQSPTTATTE